MKVGVPHSAAHTSHTNTPRLREVWLCPTGTASSYKAWETHVRRGRRLSGNLAGTEEGGLFSSQARRSAYSVLRGWTLSSKGEKSSGDLEMEINDQSLNPYSRGLVEKRFRDR